MPIILLSTILLTSLLAVLSWYHNQTNLMQRLELIMGRNIPDNGKVTDRMMNTSSKSTSFHFLSMALLLMVRVYGKAN